MHDASSGRRPSPRMSSGARACADRQAVRARADVEAATRRRDSRPARGVRTAAPRAFFAWAEVEHQKVIGERGLLRTALGLVRQKAGMLRYLDDRRLVMDNNRSERELRRIAIGKAWLFVGSDDHAQ